MNNRPKRSSNCLFFSLTLNIVCLWFIFVTSDPLGIFLDAKPTSSTSVSSAASRSSSSVVKTLTITARGNQTLSNNDDVAAVASTGLVEEGVRYLLFPAGGVRGSRNILSTDCMGTYVDMWFTDESERQNWVFSRVPSTVRHSQRPLSASAGNDAAMIEVYHIRVAGGTTRNRRCLVAGRTRDRVSLSTPDDGDKDGRNQWLLVRHDDGTLSIMSSSSSSSSSTSGGSAAQFLRASADGLKVDLSNVDTNSGLERWKIERAE